MIEIKDLLASFNNILISEEAKKTLIIDIIKEITSISIRSQDIKIKNGTIYLNIKPVYKNELFIKKEEIFSKLKDGLGKKAPKNLI